MLDDQSFFNSSPERDSLTYPPIVILLYAFLAVFFFTLIGSSISLGLSGLWGISIESVLDTISEENTFEKRNIIRLAAFLNQLFTFLIPAIVVAILIKNKKWASFLGFRPVISGRMLMLGILLIFVAFPFAQYTYWLNKQIPLPEWMIALEESSNDVIQQILLTDRPLELLMNLFLIAVVPAFGEELLFRGVLQRQLERQFRNPILAIWVAAILFSAVHMQFQGFLPRVLLGAILGYLLYWTNNLWVPIAAHFFNNAFQVVAQYFMTEEMRASAMEMETSEQYPVWLGILSLLAMPVVGYTISQASKAEEHDKITP